MAATSTSNNEIHKDIEGEITYDNITQNQTASNENDNSDTDDHLEKSNDTLRHSVKHLKKTIESYDSSSIVSKDPTIITCSIEDNIHHNLESSSTTSNESINDLDEASQYYPERELEASGGNLTTFVSEDFNELARFSSATPSSVSSASGWSGVSRSPTLHSPDCLPPVDIKALGEIEASAQKIAISMGKMMDSMAANLHLMSSVTASCIDANKEGVDRTCDSVDASIKSMYALMAKCEEISKNMQPIHKLSSDVKEVKRLLELFENQSYKHIEINFKN